MSEQQAEVRPLTADELWEFPADSRLVAIRWDLLEWGLVLDFDAPESEAADARMHRGWLAFDGVSDMTVPIRRSRLPTGCFTSGGVAQSDSDGELSEYVLSALFPTFDENGAIEAGPAKDITIKALRVVGVLSVASAAPGPNGLTYRDRVALANDQSMLIGLSEALAQPDDQLADEP